jgi:membrane protease subunit (stomatin/prohibitin family)
VTEPGGYTWNTEALDSESIFAGNGFWTPLVKNSWEKFKLGGRPQSEQQAFFVSLQELGNNKFASASEIYWDDKFLNTQAGAVVRGVFSVRLLDPLLFLKTFVPPVYLKNGRNFDLTDLDNPSAQQLSMRLLEVFQRLFLNIQMTQIRAIEFQRFRRILLDLRPR